jgi:hypothetical protein
MKKVHFWLPKALGVGEPQSSPHTHATLLKKKEEYIDWAIIIAN